MTPISSLLQWGRRRPGKVPDFKITFPTPEGPVPHLAELKVVNAAVSWYPHGTKGKGTDWRARRLTGEYKDVLRGFDVHFHGAQPWLDKQAQSEPPYGPLLDRFRGCGGLGQGQLVVGPHRSGRDLNHCIG